MCAGARVGPAEPCRVRAHLPDQAIFSPILRPIHAWQAVKTVNLYEAKMNLSRLVEQAAGGEEIVIAKAGRPLARLVPLASRQGPRPLGLLAGQVRIGADFDAPLPAELSEAFDGKLA